MGRIPSDWATPLVTPFNEAWFTSGTLAVQRCAGCDTMQHPPEEICNACGGTKFDYKEVASQGTVYSYTVAHYAAHPSLADSVPYAVVLVSLDEAPQVRVVGNLRDCDPADVHIRMPVVAYWEERSGVDGSTLLMPQWRPA